MHKTIQDKKGFPIKCIYRDVNSWTFRKSDSSISEHFRIENVIFYFSLRARNSSRQIAVCVNQLIFKVSNNAIEIAQKRMVLFGTHFALTSLFMYTYLYNMKIDSTFSPGRLMFFRVEDGQ